MFQKILLLEPAQMDWEAFNSDATSKYILFKKIQVKRQKGFKVSDSFGKQTLGYQQSVEETKVGNIGETSN